MRLWTIGCLCVVGFVTACVKVEQPPAASAASAKEPVAKQDSADTKSPKKETEAKTASAKQPPKPVLSAEEIADGWIQLFDGESLFGWKPNSDVNWSVADGVITADKGTKPGLLLTSVPFADYELHCDFWMAKLSRLLPIRHSRSPITVTTRQNPPKAMYCCH